MPRSLPAAADGDSIILSRLRSSCDSADRHESHAVHRNVHTGAFVSFAGPQSGAEACASRLHFSQGGIYCCYDAINRIDLRCELAFPDEEGLTCYTVDAEDSSSTPVAIDESSDAPDVWTTARVSAALRSMRGMHTTLALRAGGCVHRVGIMPSSPSDEAQLLDAVMRLRSLPSAGVVVAALARRLNPEQVAVLEHMAPSDVVLDLIQAHFCATKRSAAGAVFFTRALGTPPVPGVPHPASALAATLAAQSKWSEARAQLLAALETCPEDILLHLWLVKVLIGSGDAQAAVSAARGAVRVAPSVRAAWLLLAAACARAEHWGAALVALNCAPAVEAVEEEVTDVWTAAFPVGLPTPQRIVGEGVPDPSVEEEACSAEDNAMLHGRRRLAALPAASLVAPPHALYYAAGGGEGAPPLSLSVRACTACYDVLVDAATSLGWDALLDLRGQVFVMEGEMQEPLPKAIDGAREGDASAVPPAADASDVSRLASAAEAGVPAPRSEEAPLGLHAMPGAAEPIQAARPPDDSSAAADAGGEDAQAGADAVLLASDDETALEEVLLRRRLCAPWLDTMLSALYLDLAEYTDWRNAEAIEARKASGQASADDLAADTDSALGTQGDWLRRGALCERLKRVDDAERAYRVCVHLSTFNVTAWRSLARIYASWGWAPEALHACAQLDHGLAGLEHQNGACAVPVSVAHPVRALIAGLGLQAVRDAQQQIGEPSAVVNACFHAAVQWRMHGWDR